MTIEEHIRRNTKVSLLVLCGTILFCGVFQLWWKSQYDIAPWYAKRVVLPVFFGGLAVQFVLGWMSRCPRCGNRFRTVNIVPPFKAHSCPRCDLDFTQPHPWRGPS